MAVELGARAALIAVDAVTDAALKGHSHSGKFLFQNENWTSDPEANFDKDFTILGSDIEPLIHGARAQISPYQFQQKYLQIRITYHPGKNQR